MSLTLFETMFLTHLVSDWLLQTDWQAKNKAESFLPLFVHCAIYTLLFIPTFYYFKINWLFLLLLFFSHMVLDNRSFEHWWIKKVKKVKKDNISESMWNILVTGIDQSFHLLILGVIAMFS